MTFLSTALINFSSDNILPLSIVSSKAVIFGFIERVLNFRFLYKRRGLFAVIHILKHLHILLAKVKDACMMTVQVNPRSPR